MIEFKLTDAVAFGAIFVYSFVFSNEFALLCLGFYVVLCLIGEYYTRR